MTNTHKKRLISKDDEMDRDVIGKKIGESGLALAVVSSVSFNTIYIFFM